MNLRLVPLLTTKLSCPCPYEDGVARPHLIRKLNQGSTRQLLLLCAPAGWGKTTLLAEWVHQRSSPVAWVALDEGDNDSIRFLLYMIRALQTIRPELGRQALDLLLAPSPPGVEA